MHFSQFFDCRTFQHPYPLRRFLPKTNTKKDNNYYNITTTQTSTTNLTNNKPHQQTTITSKEVVYSVFRIYPVFIEETIYNCFNHPQEIES